MNFVTKEPINKGWSSAVSYTHLIFFAQTLCLLVVVLETLISPAAGTLLVPCVQPDTALVWKAIWQAA